MYSLIDYITSYGHNRESCGYQDGRIECSEGEEALINAMDKSRRESQKRADRDMAKIKAILGIKP